MKPTTNLLDFKNDDERKEFIKDVTKEKMKQLHEWSTSKIKRLSPETNIGGWLNVHLMILIKEAYDLGCEATNKINKTK